VRLERVSACELASITFNTHRLVLTRSAGDVLVDVRLVELHEVDRGRHGERLDSGIRYQCHPSVDRVRPTAQRQEHLPGVRGVQRLLPNLSRLAFDDGVGREHDHVPSPHLAEDVLSFGLGRRLGIRSRVRARQVLWERGHAYSEILDNLPQELLSSGRLGRQHERFARRFQKSAELVERHGPTRFEKPSAPAFCARY